MRWPLLIAGLAAVLAPPRVGVAPTGFALGPWLLLAGALVLYASLALPAPPRAWSRVVGVGLLLAACVGVAANVVLAPVGIDASYWAGPAPRGALERSLDFPGLADATRRHGELDLRGEAFRVDFLNDAARFNVGPEIQPGRDQLPFAVQFRGWLIVPSDGQRVISLQANGPAQVSIDDAPVISSEARYGVPAAATSRQLNRGPHRIVVDYRRPEAIVPRLTVSWDRVPGGPLAPIDATDLRTTPSGTVDSTPGVALTWLAHGLLALSLVVWLGMGISTAARARQLMWPALGLVPLAFMAHGLALQAPLFDRATILSGLDDWLIYESSARDIALHGLLMDGGQGHAPPFYGQPLYPYALALAHALTGESLFGPLAIQFASLGLVLLGTFVLARRAFGAWLDGLAAMAVLWVFVEVQPEYFKVARQLFNENLYMPLVVASLAVVVDLARRREPSPLWRAGLAGVLLGVTAISRSQFLAFVPFGLLVLLLAWRSRPLRALSALLAVVAGLLVAVAPVTARNLVVSGQLVPISSSGGASLLEFHRPPPGLIDPASLARDPLFNALHLDMQTRTVLAFARADPGGYVATLEPLGAHSVGLPGRNDPGIYWPLLVVSLLYLSSFGLPWTRRLHVWPIHAFVGTHLLILMLFEADTYGYRLVMPMYAPMMAVAAQVPLALLRFVMRRRLAVSLRTSESPRAGRYAAVGWGALCVVALVLQARSMSDGWSQREPTLHGLGGAAARAAQAADLTGAEQVFVASVDGTPRRFGAGSLPGMRYPWLRWFDPSRSLPVPDPSTSAVYGLSELVGQHVTGDMTGCLGQPDSSGDVVAAADAVWQQCASDVTPLAPPITFENVAEVQRFAAAAAVVAGQPLETRFVWRPLVARADPHQFSLQLDDPEDGDGTQWGNGTLDVYPASEWLVGDTILSRVPVATDATAIPQPNRLTLGLSSTKTGAAPATAMVANARMTRVPVAQVGLQAGTPAAGDALPEGVQALAGPRVAGGGLELVGVRNWAAEASVGGSLKLGLIWRALADAPPGGQMTVRLVTDAGSIIQEQGMPTLSARVRPESLRAGNVVRDDRTLGVGPRAPAGRVWVDIAVDGSSTRLGSLQLAGRGHAIDTASPAIATFGGAMDVLATSVEPTQVKAGGKVSVKVRWRAASEMQQAYKVFVHVLSPDGQSVVAQRDAEPQDGKAPTTAWVDSEVIEDEYGVSLPAALPAGRYPIEIGVYDARSGTRLGLANGDNRLLLPTQLSAP